MTTSGSPNDRPPSGVAAREPLWADVRDELRRRGLRWTPQRRLVLDVLAGVEGHITASELVERCRDRDPDVTPSTVYRTLDVVELLGYARHSHSGTGQEEFHVFAGPEHGHLECRGCGRSWDLERSAAADLVRPIRRQFGFEADLGHLTITGYCADCSAKRGDAVRP